MFDGKVWKCYGLSHGLPSVEINDLGLDKNGDLWAATAAGIASFEQNSFKQLNEKGGPDNQITNCVYFDNGNNIWIGTARKGVYAKLEDKWHHYTTKQGLSVNTVSTITQSWDRSLWSASWTNIARWSGEGWKLYSSMERLGTFGARFLTSTKERLWFFTNNGVHSSKMFDWTHFTEEQGLISNDVTSGFVESDEKIYVGTSEGMSIIDNGVIENYFIPNSMVGYNCISIAIDNRNRVWVGTWESGLNLYDSGYWTQPRGKNENMLSTVRSMVFGPNGEIVFNTLGGVVFKNGNKWNIQSRNNGVSGNDVRCGVFDNKSRYWAGTSSGICYYHNGKWSRFRKIHGLPSDDIWACAVDASGTVWFGTTEGIISISENTLVDRTPETGLKNIDIRSILVFGNSVYFGTSSGKLLEYNGISWEVFGNDYLNTDKGLFSMAMESTGTLWLGTDGDGVIRLKNGKTTHFTIDDGLPSNFVRAIAYNKDTLWAACYGGTVALKIQKTGE